MPIITETVTSSASPSYESVALNFANAIAKAVGTESKIASDGSPYVPMDSIGYPGWSVVIHHTGSSYFRCYIYTANPDGTPNFGDDYMIVYGYTNKPVSYDYYKSATCVMIHDTNKDTVAFNIHPGSTSDGSDISINGNTIDFTFFFAKDANDNVMCGVGRFFPTVLRTAECKAVSDGNIQKQNTLSCLHLTKMVNYLSPGCPEMKSAYVSIMRPLSDAEEKKYTKLYQINGSQYGRASFSDSWDSDNIADGKCYYPFDPIVKY